MILNALAIALVFSLLPIQVVATNITARQRDQLIGPVKRLTIERARLYTNAQGVRSEGPRIIFRSVAYSALGEKLEEVGYVNTGAVGFKKVWSYNDNGTKAVELHYDKGDRLFTRRTHQYDDEGRILSEVVHQADGSLAARIVYKYDEMSRRLEEARYNLFGNLIGTKKSTYDGDGGRTEVSEGLYMRGPAKTVGKFDRDGNLTEETEYDSPGRTTSRTLFKRDLKNLPLEIARYDGSNSLRETSTYSYDQRGNLLEFIEYEGDHSIKARSVSVYQFDSYGNWVRQETARFSAKQGQVYPESTEITYRSMSYY